MCSCRTGGRFNKWIFHCTFCSPKKSAVTNWRVGHNTQSLLSMALSDCEVNKKKFCFPWLRESLFYSQIVKEWSFYVPHNDSSHEPKTLAALTGLLVNKCAFEFVLLPSWRPDWGGAGCVSVIRHFRLYPMGEDASCHGNSLPTHTWKSLFLTFLKLISIGHSYFSTVYSWNIN